MSFSRVFVLILFISQTYYIRNDKIISMVSFSYKSLMLLEDCDFALIYFCFLFIFLLPTPQFLPSNSYFYPMNAGYCMIISCSTQTRTTPLRVPEALCKVSGCRRQQERLFLRAKSRLISSVP